MSQEFSWQTLLTNALRSGMSAIEFWQLTPRETVLALEAAAWRMERERERSLWQAWHIAALGRTKTLPRLHRLLHPPETRALTGEEKDVRQREFEEMRARALKSKR